MVSTRPLALLVLAVGAGCTAALADPAPAPAPPLEGVTIGTQVWATRNLDVATFRNGDPVGEANTQEAWLERARGGFPAWAWPGGDPANGPRFGRLYNWRAAADPRGLCPEGWHLPSDEEWTTLITALGAEQAGTRLKSKAGWTEGNGTDDVGFGGLPAGRRGSAGDMGKFYSFGTGAVFWTATPTDTGARGRRLSATKSTVEPIDYYADAGYAVRCVKDGT